MLKKFIQFHPLYLIILVVVASCSRVDNIEKRLDTLEHKVETLEQAIGVLQDSFEKGKLITDVSLTDVGYKITFSDNSSINILHGSNGVTPILSIDAEGYWNVSYDSGKSFQALIDSEGNPIIGVGRDGIAGANGEDGICVRVSISENGNYIFEMYYKDDPNNVIDKVETNYTSDKSKIISSIVENTEEGTITITTADGKTFFTKTIVLTTGVYLDARTITGEIINA